MSFNILCEKTREYAYSLIKPVWSNYRPEGRMWPATTFPVARRSFQEKPSNLRFVEKCVSLSGAMNSVLPNKSAYLFAKCDLLKMEHEPN